ncbi:hypothetical protein Sbal117_4581 (plasmid) [Shewanella baltica OS117]|nr:hypothetical protein Sbal117_4581 [Shewanella baltica OS117]
MWTPFLFALLTDNPPYAQSCPINHLLNFVGFTCRVIIIMDKKKIVWRLHI